MRALPVEGQGLIVCHSLVAEGVFTTKRGRRSKERDYTTSSGMLMQCCHCRRVRAIMSAEPDRWDFIPELVNSKQRRALSHALCPECLAYHYYQYLDANELRVVLSAAMDQPKVLAEDHDGSASSP